MSQLHYELNFIGQTEKYLYLIEINQKDDEEKNSPLQYGVCGINEAKVFEQHFINSNPKDIYELIEFINSYESNNPFSKNRELIDKLSTPNIAEISNNIAIGIDGGVFDLNTLKELEESLKKFENLSELVKSKYNEKQTNNEHNI